MGKTIKLPAKLGALVGRDIVKLFRNVLTEELEWYTGRVTKLICGGDLAVWRRAGHE